MSQCQNNDDWAPHDEDLDKIIASGYGGNVDRGYIYEPPVRGVISGYRFNGVCDHCGVYFRWCQLQWVVNGFYCQGCQKREYERMYEGIQLLSIN